jgi:uncharacterized protein YjbI with pentapeptide repeats
MANQEQLAWLKRGAREWNRWREKNPKIEIDISEAYLYSSDLSEADLSEADLSGANLSRADLSEADLSEADLSGANLSRAELSGAILYRADLSGADLSGADLGRADLGEADLSRADLSEADLNKTWLNKAWLSGADLSGADLVGADLSGAILYRADLYRADLSGAILYRAVLGRADLSGADLSGADLSKANLNEANLSGANLSGADLSGTDLIEANALNTNFTRANLTGACIQDWNINQKTIFEEVICDYIYYKFDWETRRYQERRPHDPNKIFNAGDFQRLIETARETVDLIFSDGIDWKAFLESFHGLQIESENGELSIAGILKRRDGTFVIQIDAPQDTDKADLENRFYQKYNKLLQQAKHYYQKLQLTERDIQSYQRENANLRKIIELQASQPMINANNIGSVNSGQIIGDNNKFAGILNEAEQQNLTEIITEVQAIITPLAQTYPNDKTMQGIKTIEVIKNDPNLKQKLINAAQKGGLEFLKKSFDNPVGALIGGAIEGWMGK